MNKTGGKARVCLSLFLSFAKIGAFTFGGGYAMLPLIRREAVGRHGWISDEELLDITAIAESTPGPIAINSATFIGRRAAGFFGALCATAGVVLPSFIIISLLSLVIDKVGDIRAVKYAFLGIRAGVTALILRALISLINSCPKNAPTYIIAGLSFVLSAVFSLPVYAILPAAAAAGLVLSLRGGIKE